MNAELNRWIRKYVRGKYNEFDLDEAIEDVQLLFDLTADDVYSPEKYLSELMESNDILLQLKSSIDIEKLMSMMINIVDPSMTKKPPKPLFRDDRRTNWSLGNFYKEAFRVVPWEFNLSGETRDLHTIERHRSDHKYVYYYLLAYFYRNKMLSHSGYEPTPEDEIAVISSYLVVMLDICRRYHDRLVNAHEVKRLMGSFSAEEYMKEIIERYENSEKNGFGYVNMSWYIPQSAVRTHCDAEKLASMEVHNGLKLVGIAGTGKSTVLRRIEYILAKAFQKKQNNIIPVYVELADVVDDEDILISKIAAVLDISTDNAEAFLRRGGITLLLDGYNEILDPIVKRKLAKELDNLTRGENIVNLILSDRTENSTVPTLQKSTAMFLKPITIEDRKQYYKANCHDEQALRVILDKLDSDPEFFNELDTPLKLKQLSVVVSDTGSIPESLTSAYINCLFEREQYEKKDENMEYLPMFLQSLALLDEEEIPFPKALNQMAKCKNAMGFSIPDTQKCLNLAVEMGVLAREENIITFSGDDYRAHFFIMAINSGLDELLS